MRISSSGSMWLVTLVLSLANGGSVIAGVFADVGGNLVDGASGWTATFAT